MLVLLLFSYVGAPGLDQSKIIVTQAPLDGTTRDFWRMIWEQRTSAVVVIATEDEGQWWPKGQGGQQRHSLVIGRGWVDGESKNTLLSFSLPSSSLLLLFALVGETYAISVNLIFFSYKFCQVV